MKKFIALEKIEGGYKCIFENGVYIGDILVKEDGFYDWWPPHLGRGGCWSSYVLRELADKIDELNEPYQKEMEKFFEETKTT